MQVLIREIEGLNEQVQKQNAILMRLLEKQLKWNQTKQTSKIKSQNTEYGIDEGDSLIHQETKPMFGAVVQKNSKVHESGKFSITTLNNSRSNKTIRKCDSCKSVSKSRKSSSSTTVKHEKILKQKHENNMMKLQKLSQKIIPKVSKSWLYKKKTKIFHFQ